MDRRTEVELARLEERYKARVNEMALCVQFDDFERAEEYVKEARRIKIKMAVIEKGGVRKKSKLANIKATRKYDKLYGPCAELVF